MKPDIIIGIDPDVDLSGVARVDVAEKRVWADTLPFPLLLEYILTVREVARVKKKSLLVVVEASWKIAHNWHLTRYDTPRTAAQKGEDVGRCKELGKKLVEMLNHYGIEVKEQLPLKKIWNGPDGKITHDELVYFTKWDKKRSNQEQRDAILLAWNESGLPMRARVYSNNKK